MGIKEDVYRAMGFESAVDVYDKVDINVKKRDLTSRENIAGLGGSYKDTQRCSCDDKDVVVSTNLKINRLSPNAVTLRNKIMGASE